MPLSRRQIYRRRRITVFGTLAVVLVAAFYLPTTLLAPLPAASAAVAHVAAPAPKPAVVTWPTYGASAVGAVSFDGILAKSGSEAQLPMASISKIITTLVVLDAKPMKLDDPGPTITFGPADVALYNHYLALNGSIEPVRAGQSLSELEALQVALIPSANNYAASLALWAYGSEATFLTAANAWLTKNGLTSTTFIEPTGINPANTATASDLVILGKLAIANPVITKIVSTAKITIPGVGTVENTNKLLGTDGVTGLKTGTLDKFGANLLFSATEPVGDSSVTIVGVVLGGKTHPKLDRDIRTMLAGVVAGFHQVRLTTKGERFGSYATAWGKSDLVAEAAKSVVVWSKTPISLLVTSSTVAVGRAGTNVGRVTFTVGQKSIEVPLELATTVADPGPVWRLSHPAALL